MSITFSVSGVNQSFTISNHNFYTLCGVVGLNFVPSGKIDPVDFEGRLEYLAAAVEKNNCPFGVSQILDYYCELQCLVLLGKLTDQPIQWG